jgi:hypothetical protein
MDNDPAAGDMKVIVAKDAEGNGYSPLADLGLDKYIADSTWSGELIHPDDAPDYPEAEDVIALWPVN